MKSTLTFSFLMLAWLLTSCSSMMIQISSEPTAASVFLKKGQLQKKIGETPLSISATELGGSGPYNFVIEKEGFQSERILIEERSLSANAEIYSSLKKINTDSDRQIASESALSHNGHRAIASIQSQLHQKNFSQAEALSRDFVTQNPYSPVGWNLLGNSILLQNRNSEALEAYRRALEYDPENQDTLKMIRFLDSEPVRRGQ